MTPGFRVRDPVTGAVKVDGTRRLLILAGTVIIPAGSSGTIVSNAFAMGEPFCFCSGVRNDATTSFPITNFIPPTISFSGGVMTYNNPGAAHRLMYGQF
ncbi:MAG: hypothetical protein DI527_18950 [Chelatococcus sp.]|nr:MAG: hypothetical protein DI527_18950 [Chelatococcus sp.]